MSPGPFGRRGGGRENGFRRPAGKPRMTYSKTAAIRTAIAVIAALFRAGCMSGGHGVKRMAGARARRSRRERTRIHGRKRQARDRGHGSWNHGGAVSRQRDRRLARPGRPAICGPFAASRVGDPSKRGTLPLAQSQYRQRRGDYANPHRQIGLRHLLSGITVHRDRRRAHRVSPRQRLPPARQRVAGIELAPRLPMAACPALERRRSIQLSLRGPAVPAPSGSVTPARARA